MASQRYLEIAKADPPPNCGRPDCTGCTDCDDLYHQWCVKHGIGIDEAYVWPRIGSDGWPIDE